MILKMYMKRSELDRLVISSIGDKESIKVLEFLDQEFSTLEEFWMTTGSVYSKGKTTFYSKITTGSK